MSKERKYTYLRVLQQNIGYGFEDVDCFDLHKSTVQERKQRLKEYRENQPQANYRWIDRRELNK